MRYVLLCLLMLFEAPQSAQAAAQYLTGITGIFKYKCSTTCPIDSWSYTELDYEAAQWYAVVTDGTLKQGSTVKAADKFYGYIEAEFMLSMDLVKGNSASVDTTHGLLTYFYYQTPDNNIDRYGFSLIGNGTYGDAGSVPGTGTLVYVQEREMDVFATHAAFKAPVINKDGTAALDPTTRGSTGYMELYGEELYYAESVSISGDGVTAVATYSSHLQANIQFTIDPDAATGDRDLTITTIFGTSNTATFKVDDRTPEITSIAPSDWMAGGTTSFSVQGDWFGSNPEITVSGTGITGSGIVGTCDSTCDHEFTAWVAVSPDAPSGTATVTVKSNGFSGTAFQASSAGAGGDESAPASAEIFERAVVSMKLELVNEEFKINKNNNYSEDQTIRITAVRNDTGATMTAWTGTVPIEEISTGTRERIPPTAG